MHPDPSSIDPTEKSFPRLAVKNQNPTTIDGNSTGNLCNYRPELPTKIDSIYKQKHTQSILKVHTVFPIITYEMIRWAST